MLTGMRGVTPFLGLAVTGFLGVGAGCDNTMPSARLNQEVNLPVPISGGPPPDPTRLVDVDQGLAYTLTPANLIALAFSLQPDIKSSFERFKSEEGRYDFFYTSRDSLTPRFNIGNTFGEVRADEGVVRDRSHTFELGLEKLFFDTTEMDVAVGLRSRATDQAIGEQPFISTTIRYPFWASREKLARTSEDIFRRNELNDVQLDYIQQVRSRLQRALFRFHDVVRLQHELQNTQRWLDDLKALHDRIQVRQGRDVESDRQRVAAEIARISADYRNLAGRYEIQTARLKSAIGLPFHAALELVDEPFNPFTDQEHQALLHASIESDPEIATLKNALRNAEVQLDLARRGTWDFALVFNGQSFLEGRGEDEGVSEWSVSAGLEIGAVDRRVTESLIHQAQGNIHRFTQAIAARENAIYTDTLEPVIRIRTLSESRDDLMANLPRYQSDYDKGLTEYDRGDLNIDDLLTRRNNLFDQDQEIVRLKAFVGFNIAELCAATGKFFELLELPRDADGLPIMPVARRASPANAGGSSSGK